MLNACRGRNVVLGQFLGHTVALKPSRAFDVHEQRLQAVDRELCAHQRFLRRTDALHGGRFYGCGAGGKRVAAHCRLLAVGVVEAVEQGESLLALSRGHEGLGLHAQLLGGCGAAFLLGGAGGGGHCQGHGCQ